MRARRRLAFHRHREAGNRLENRILVRAVLARANATTLERDEGTHGGDSADDCSERARDHLLFGQYHRRIAETAGGVTGAMDAVFPGNPVEFRPEETHVAHAHDA